MTTLLKLIGVAIAYVVVGTLLYRQRIVSGGASGGSDLVIFALPAIGALVANGLILAMAVPNSWHLAAKLFGVIFGTLILTAVVALVAATIMFNFYGT